MLVIIVIMLIAGGIAFYQVFTQGFFSSVIMCVLCLASALIAFNYYEVLGTKLNRIGLAHLEGNAISLMGLFLASLLITRLAFDRLIKGNMKFPLIVDRIASGVFGLVAGIVIAGMVALEFQMLPISSTLLGFNRFPNVADRDLEERKNLFPSADGFVAAVVGQASKHGFSGSERFAHYHPDLLEELYVKRLTLDPYSRQNAAGDSVRVEKAWLLPNDVYDSRRNEMISAPAREIFLAIRLSIQAGEPKEKTGAADADGKIRFTLGNIRLLGFDENDKDSEGVTRYPVGILKPGFKVVDSLGFHLGRELDSSRAVDLVFSWPETMKAPPPLYVEFKSSARASLPSVSQLKEEASPPPDQWFAASKNVPQADMEAPAESNVTYNCKSLSIWSPDNPQGQKDFKFPLIGSTPESRESQKYVEIVSPTFEGNRYKQTHFRLQSRTAGMIKDAKAYDLFVPRNSYLLCLRIDGNQANLNSSFILPTLVDANNNEIFAAGMKMSAQAKGNQVELAYSVNSPGIPYPQRIWLAQQKGNMSRKDALLVFYLIHNQTPPVGIIGCRTRTSRTDAGQIWNFTGNVDSILAAPAAENK
jgi:uncharacterized membrane protein required for colicin V production